MAARSATPTIARIWRGRTTRGKGRRLRRVPQRGGHQAARGKGAGGRAAARGSRRRQRVRDHFLLGERRGDVALRRQQPAANPPPAARRRIPHRAAAGRANPRHRGVEKRVWKLGRSGAHFPAALRSAALMRSCQPGPSSWKKSSTSRSMRSDTISLAPGTACGGGGRSAGLVVAVLNAFSASLRELRIGRSCHGGTYTTAAQHSLFPLPLWERASALAAAPAGYCGWPCPDRICAAPNSALRKAASKLTPRTPHS